MSTDALLLVSGVVQHSRGNAAGAGSMQDPTVALKQSAARFRQVGPRSQQCLPPPNVTGKQLPFAAVSYPPLLSDVLLAVCMLACKMGQACIATWTNAGAALPQHATLCVAAS